MKIIDNIKEEHTNRAKWIDENLTARERMRLDRHTSIKVIEALMVYGVIMWVLSMCI